MPDYELDTVDKWLKETAPKKGAPRRYSTPRPKHLERKYQHYKKDTCERCGFIAEDSCQLDVDHIDSNHNNNHPSNLQTLCANCHRLKTKVERIKIKLDNLL